MKQPYLLCAKNRGELKHLAKQYEESHQINDNDEGNLEENRMIALEMTEQEAEALAENPEISSIEKDRTVEANWKSVESRGDVKYNKKKEKRIKRNTGNTEWNARMIRAGKVKKGTGKRNGIKIAVLD